MSRPQSLRQWAKRLGMPFETFRRQVNRINDEIDGKLIVVRHGKKVITEAGLREFCPEYFHDEQSNAQRIEVLEQNVREQEWKIEQLTASYKAFRAKAHEWFAKQGAKNS